MKDGDSVLAMVEHIQAELEKHRQILFVHPDDEVRIRNAVQRRWLGGLLEVRVSPHVKAGSVFAVKPHEVRRALGIPAPPARLPQAGDLVRGRTIDGKATITGFLAPQEENAHRSIGESLVMPLYSTTRVHVWTDSLEVIAEQPRLQAPGKATT